MRDARQVPKNCTLCSRFWFDAGWGGTDVTPGDPPEMRCKSKMVDADLHFRSWDGEDELRNALLQADTCIDFEWFDAEKPSADGGTQ